MLVNSNTQGPRNLFELTVPSIPTMPAILKFVLREWEIIAIAGPEIVGNVGIVGILDRRQSGT